MSQNEENDMTKLRMRFRRLLDWLKNRQIFKRVFNHFGDYPYVWLVFVVLLLGAWIFVSAKWTIAKLAIRLSLIILLALFLIRPMNAVYGLIGTSGSISLLFINFLAISLIFAIVYQCFFFSNAGISYDTNQPHIDYQLFQDTDKEDSTKVSFKRDTLYFEHQLDTILFKESVVNVRKDSLYYHRINFGQVWRSSIITTLTQGPTDLLSAATVHNSGINSSNVALDKEKSTYLEWILIFHILISWIFFGVFISLLYNKFRYES